MSKNERTGADHARTPSTISSGVHQYITNGGRTVHARRRPSPAEYITNGGRKQVNS